MRARITLAVVAVLVGALALAAGVSFALVRHEAIDNSRTEVLRVARTIATRERIVFDTKYSGVITSLINETAGVSESVVQLHDGKLYSAKPKLKIPTSRVDGSRLAAGKNVSGVAGNWAYALVPIGRISTSDLGLPGVPGTIVLALAVEHPVSDVASSIGYFLLAGAISLLVAAAVVAVIARRISHRVLAASATARRIADGDLDARVEVSARAYPELAGLDEAINSMAENLARARDQERQFLMSISHDLRTPLTSIRGYAEAIRERAVEDPSQAASVVTSEAVRLERLIGDLLDLAKLEARQFRLRTAVCDLTEALREAAEALRIDPSDRGVTLTLKLPRHALIVVADAQRIAQMLANLVDNAVKFASSSIVVRLEADDAGPVKLSVEDDGPGIDPEDLPRIFDRLFSSARRSTRAPGSGLGLAIVAELAEAMEGSVSAESPINGSGGTRITVELPLPRAFPNDPDGAAGGVVVEHPSFGRPTGTA